ncbi:hypothetical protein MKX01_027063 [Papaver californicum]|nr:hypothetical protein MKX01_027063 [Papaver californicum]
MNDAIAYVTTVKEKFRDNREKYDEFLNILEDFKVYKIDTLGVMSRIKVLFKGHPDLILGFNTFTPEGNEISTTMEDEPSQKKPPEFVDFMIFLNQVQTRFQNDDHVFELFLGVLLDILVKSKSITEVYNEVAYLFHQHPDLLNEFKYFL